MRSVLCICYSGFKIISSEPLELSIHFTIMQRILLSITTAPNTTIQTKQIKFQNLNSQVIKVNEHDFTCLFEFGDRDESNGLLFTILCLPLDDGGGKGRLITGEEQMGCFVDHERLVGLEWIAPFFSLTFSMAQRKHVIQGRKRGDCSIHSVSGAVGAEHLHLSI